MSMSFNEAHQKGLCVNCKREMSDCYNAGECEQSHEEQKQERRVIVQVSTDTENYYVGIPAGTNVAEVAFAVQVLVRALERDKVIDHVAFLDMVQHYLSSEQFGEVN